MPELSHSPLFFINLVLHMHLFRVLPSICPCSESSLPYAPVPSLPSNLSREGSHLAAPSSTPGQPVPGSFCTLETSHLHPRLSFFKLEPSRMGVGQRTKPLPSSAPGLWDLPSRLPAPPCPSLCPPVFPVPGYCHSGSHDGIRAACSLPNCKYRISKLQKETDAIIILVPKGDPTPCLNTQEPRDGGGQWGGEGKAEDTRNLSLSLLSSAGRHAVTGKAGTFVRCPKIRGMESLSRKALSRILREGL